jgi:hypothetical protein
MRNWDIVSTGFAILTIAASLAACQAPPAIERVEAPVEGKNIVFGRVDVQSSNRPSEWSGSCADKIYLVCPDDFEVWVVRSGSRELTSHRLAGDGSFYWTLAPGAYSLLGWEWQTFKAGTFFEGSKSRTRSGRIGGQFTVPADKNTVYLGTIEIQLSDSRYRSRVLDDHDVATRRLHEKFPTVETEPAASLVRLQGDPVTARLVSICDPRWGLECLKEIHGVTPVSPASRALEFAPVGSLQPTLEWRPAAGANVTYDVMVYEALPHTGSWQPAMLAAQPGWMSTRYVQGALVDSATGLREPWYALKAPLQPNSKYFWTVRLRDGEAVSDWSTLSFGGFSFLVFIQGMSSGSGWPFSFSTM